jgi:hypothetical protein
MMAEEEQRQRDLAREDMDEVREITDKSVYGTV